MAKFDMRYVEEVIRKIDRGLNYKKQENSIKINMENNDICVELNCNGSYNIRRGTETLLQRVSIYVVREFLENTLYLKKGGVLC